MAICSFFLEGRCRYGDRCWNEHPRGGRHQEQNRYQQPGAGSRQWTSSNQRYVQPSSFPKSTTWTRDNSQTSFAPRSDFHDNRSRQNNSGSAAGLFSSQNRFSSLSSQDQSRETQSDKDGSLIEDIRRDLDVWESSGQWIFSSYCVIKDARNVTGFVDISPEELRLEWYTARDSGNLQNYVNSVQQLANQWKQRILAIKNTNISSQTALMNELTKPATGSAPVFGGQQSSTFPSTGSSASTAAQPAVNFSFKSDPSHNVPNTGPVPSLPSVTGFVNKPATGFGTAATGFGTTATGFGTAATASAASFSFAATTASSSGFSNTKAVAAATFSFAPATSPAAGTPAFSGFATTAAPASTSSTATNVFGGTTAAPSFGQSSTSSFGAAPSTFGFGAGNPVTSGFGAKTSAVSELFRSGAASSAISAPFGQASGVSVSRSANVTTATEAGSENPLFTSRSELSAKELSQFEASKFTVGLVPLHPPPANLLVV